MKIAALALIIALSGGLTGDVNDVVDKTVESVEDVVEDTVDTLDDVVNDTTSDVDRAVRDTERTTRDPIQDATDPIDNSLDRVSPGPGVTPPPAPREAPAPPTNNINDSPEQDSSEQDTVTLEPAPNVQDEPQRDTLQGPPAPEPEPEGFFRRNVMNPIIKVIEVVPLWVWWQLGLSVGLITGLVLFVRKQRRELAEFMDEVHQIVREEMDGA